ncbi:hypothetical protein FOCC_FOCC013250 [Frankliniella occidentalis]|nr:hypothetical protein FOCC_FOCC013250 [Frankliniella occidentalis]
MAENRAVIAVVVEELIDDEDENDLVMMMARIAVDEIMELREGDGLGFRCNWPVLGASNCQHDYFTLGDRCFKLHLRMSRGVFEKLVKVVENYLIFKQVLKRKRRPFADAMLMVVWILATTDTFRSVALGFNVSPGTLYHVYEYVVEGLRQLAPQFITWPDEEERRQIKTTFQRATGFPGVVGCNDGTHIFITASVDEAAQYRNRYCGYSMNVQAVVDSTLLDAAGPNSTCMARTARPSGSFWMSLSTSACSATRLAAGSSAERNAAEAAVTVWPSMQESTAMFPQSRHQKRRGATVLGLGKQNKSY